MGVITDNLLLNRYKIISKLGSGGYSDVYRAFDTRMARDVAIKRIRLSRHSAERVLREARTVALLNHPNIVTIHEFEEAGGECYLIMEFIQGVPLSRVLECTSPLAPDEAVVIATEICRALEAAHDSGIVHRDIKPENVMILYDGRLKVMDFGIARIKGASIATSDDIVGTFVYMSPEQARGEMVDERSDIFSLGTVLYEMLTDNIPFSGETTTETLYNVQTVEPIPPSKLNGLIDREIDVCVMTALAKDTESRYPNAAEFREHLQSTRTTTMPADKILADLAYRCVEPEEEPPPVTGSDWRARLWRGIENHYGVVTRLPIAVLLAASFFPMLHSWFGMSRGISGFLAVVVFLTVLLLPAQGVGSAFFLLSLASIKYSVGLFIIMLLFLIPYWYVITRRWPLFSVSPAAGAAFALLNIPFVFPILIGLLANPIAAAATAGLGAISFELLNIFLRDSTSPEIMKGYGVWEAIRGESNPLNVARLLISPFFRDPILLLQPVLWAVTAALTSIVRGSRRWASAIIAGFVILVMGYQGILSKAKHTGINTDALMQGLSFSLIILLLLLILRPPAALDAEEPRYTDEFTDELTQEPMSEVTF